MGEHVQTGTWDVPSPAATRSLDLPPNCDHRHILQCENKIDTAGVHMHTRARTHPHPRKYTHKHKYRGFDVQCAHLFLAFQRWRRDEKEGKQFTEESYL